MNQHQRPITAEMPERERSIAEQFRIVAHQYCDADAAANLMKDLKETTLEQIKTDIITRDGHMADNKAERLARTSQDWIDYITNMNTHRTKANKLRLQLDYLRMLDRKEDREAWMARSEMKIHR
jgi:hypothetical protein